MHRARQVHELASLPGFAPDSVSKADDRKLLAIIASEGRHPIALPRAGNAVHATIQCWFRAPGRKPDTPWPKFRLLDEKQNVLATIEPSHAGAVEFDLPAASGTTTLTLDIGGMVKGGEVTARFGTIVLEALDGHDRVVLEADGAKIEERGLELRYPIQAPPPAQLLVEESKSASPPTPVTLLRGRATVASENGEVFELTRDGAPVGGEGHAAATFTLDANAHEAAQLTARRPAGAATRDRIWLLQPDAAFGRLHDPTAILEGELPPLRGRESESPHPCVRHVTLGAETRRALLLAPGSVVDFPVDIAPGDELVFATGMVELAGAGPGRVPPTLEASWIDSAGAVHTLTGPKAESNSALTDRFVERRFMLPIAAAGAGTLRFAAPVPADAGLLATSPTALALVAEPTIEHARRSTAPNVIVYLVDTLRADRCTPWRSDRDTTPHLARMAAEGVLFERAYSQAPWTRPSVATLFSGVVPSFHGAAAGSGLPWQTETLAERMRAAGLTTAAFVCNPQVSGATLAFEQGFGTLVTIGRTEARELPRADVITPQVIEWIDAHRQQPFFLYVHTLDPHAPYSPPAATAGRWSGGYRGALKPVMTTDLERRKPLTATDLRYANDLYDEEIAFADAELGRLCDHLRQIGAWDDTLIVFVSDHGEEFADHDHFGHGRRLWDELLQVPLVIKPDRREGASGAAGVRVAAPVRMLDVMPTVLARVGAPPDAATLMGVDLSESFASGTVPDLDVVAEYWNRARRLTSLRAGRWKLLRTIGDDDDAAAAAPLLFDLEADPGERTDLAGERSDIAARLLERLTATFAGWDRAGFARREARSERFTAEEEAALRALGYLDDGAPEAGGGKR
ncbi:MAG: hypothetical protein EXS13_04295 [Planctomycetes bacterium]|nr:hypothetical protein [Planctomycetota bacterium]